MILTSKRKQTTTTYTLKQQMAKKRLGGGGGSEVGGMKLNKMRKQKLGWRQAISKHGA